MFHCKGEGGGGGRERGGREGEREGDKLEEGTGCLHLLSSSEHDVVTEMGEREGVDHASTAYCCRTSTHWLLCDQVPNNQTKQKDRMITRYICACVHVLQS